jgi:hypothetical protein
MEGTIEIPKQLLFDMLADMEKDTLARYNNLWDGEYFIEELIEQGKMSKYYYELRKLFSQNEKDK